MSIIIYNFVTMKTYYSMIRSMLNSITFFRRFLVKDALFSKILMIILFSWQNFLSKRFPNNRIDIMFLINHYPVSTLGNTIKLSM